LPRWSSPLSAVAASALLKESTTVPRAKEKSFSRFFHNDNTDMCSQRHIKQRAQPSGAPPTARPSKCVISCVTRARSGAPTHTTVIETPRTRALNTQRRITGSLFTQKCVLETCGTSKLLAERPTSRPANSIISSVTRVVTREWRIHPHMHRNTLHADFGPAKTPPWTPLHSKRANNIRHLRERAHLLDERASAR